MNGGSPCVPSRLQVENVVSHHDHFSRDRPPPDGKTTPANLGLFLIGGAVGVAYVALLRLATCWFEPRFYATLSGLALFCGVGGAVSTGIPLHFLVTRFGWRPVMFAAAAVLFLIGVAIWLIIRDDPSEWGYRSFALPEPKTVFSPAKLRRDLMTVFRLPEHLAPLPLPFLLVVGLTGPVITFTGHWEALLGKPRLSTPKKIRCAVYPRVPRG